MPLTFLYIWKDFILHWLFFAAPAPVPRPYSNSSLHLRWRQQVPPKRGRYVPNQTPSNTGRPYNLHIYRRENLKYDVFRWATWFRVCRTLYVLAVERFHQFEELHIRAISRVVRLKVSRRFGETCRLYLHGKIISQGRKQHEAEVCFMLVSCLDCP
jgi:hypothetical protein